MATRVPRVGIPAKLLLVAHSKPAVAIRPTVLTLMTEAIKLAMALQLSNYSKNILWEAEFSGRNGLGSSDGKWRWTVVTPWRPTDGRPNHWPGGCTVGALRCQIEANMQKRSEADT